MCHSYEGYKWCLQEAEGAKWCLNLYYSPLHVQLTVAKQEQEQHLTITSADTNLKSQSELF